MAGVKMPTGAAWHITAELRDQESNVLYRTPVPLLWSASWARDSHISQVGQAMQVWLTSMLRHAYPTGPRR